jgi:hypothetical protein
MKVRLKFGMSFFLRFAGQPPAPAPPPRAWVSRDRTHPPLAPRTDPTHAAVSPDPISSPRLPSSTRRRDLRDLDAARLAIAWRLRTPPPLPSAMPSLCPLIPFRTCTSPPQLCTLRLRVVTPPGQRSTVGSMSSMLIFPRCPCTPPAPVDVAAISPRRPWMPPPSPPAGRGWVQPWTSISPSSEDSAEVHGCLHYVNARDGDGLGEGVSGGASIQASNTSDLPSTPVTSVLPFLFLPLRARSSMHLDDCPLHDLCR